jgi:hypothetical protein
MLQPRKCGRAPQPAETRIQYTFEMKPGASRPGHGLTRLGSSVLRWSPSGTPFNQLCLALNQYDERMRRELRLGDTMQGDSVAAGMDHGIGTKVGVVEHVLD